MSQAKLRALQQWCKNRCEGYRDVKITNMTTSWRDGLAFCALIHRFRPDLINFDSLCKENVYYNNHLAFTVAEQLGVTALLEAKDMEDLQVPDKLSVITYVASLYSYFKDKEKLGGPDVQKCKSHVSIGMKRHPDTEVYEKYEPKRLTPNKEDNTKKGSSTPTKQSSGGDYCVLCKDKVYLIEKHIEDGNLYHRSCFRKSYMSPTSKILTDYSTQKQTKPSSITINSIDKTASKNIMDSSKNDPSANVTSPRIKGKLFDKKKDQIQKAEERLKLDKQYKREIEEEEEMIENGRRSSSALKAHLKEIDANSKKSSTNLSGNSFPELEKHASYNSEKTFQTSPSRDSNLHERSNSQKREINDLAFSNVSVKSATKPESDPSLDTPKLMKQVSSRTMGDKKMQATVHNKSVSNLKDNSEQYVVSGLLKSLAGIRQRQSTSSSPTNSDPPSPLPTEPSVPNSRLSQTSTSTVTNPSTIKSISGDNSQNFKNPHFHLNKSKTSLMNSTEKESDVITAHTNHQKKPPAALDSSSKSEGESTNSTSTASNSFTPRKQTRASLRVQLPSIQQRIKDYSKVAPGIAEQPTNTKKADDAAKSDKNNASPSFPLSTIMKNEQNLKPHQEINRGQVAMDIPSSGGISATNSKSKFEISKIVKPNALSESATDIHSSHSQEKSLLKPGGKHLGNNDSNNLASGVIITKLHPGHVSPANRGSVNEIDNRVNPIPKPRREKIGLRTETAKENKENPSALKTIPEAFEKVETPNSVPNAKEEVKAEWQLEAERRIAARKVDGYIDPEVKHLNVNNNKISQNIQINGNVVESINTGQRKRIPVTRTFTFTISDSLPSQPESSFKSDTKKKTFTSSEIPLEVVDIDAKLRELELKGRQLEDIIRAISEEGQPSLAINEDEYDRKMTEWFNIINAKNELVRREHYLVFHLEEQELLREQVEIDNELQILQNSPKRTKKIKKREKQLIKEKIAVVNKRNDIVETIEENRLRYQEEDEGIQEMLSKKGFVEDD